MDDLVLVSVGHRFTHLEHQPDTLRHGQATLIRIVVDRLALDEFHAIERDPIGRITRIQHASDVGMLEAS